jgi:hypothetical protein
MSRSICTSRAESSRRICVMAVVVMVVVVMVMRA